MGVALGAYAARKLAGGAGLAAVAGYLLYRAGEDLAGGEGDLTFTWPAPTVPDNTVART